MVLSKENKAWWDERYDWPKLGDEWSRPWGDATTQWHGSILPRIHRFLPARTVLEIGCGFGRWTQFLKDQCAHLIALDLAEKCIEAVQERFSDSVNITYVVNDGSSLDAIPDASVDFVFSFDSLVHVDERTLQRYLDQLPRILTSDGAAFLHHSNVGQYSRSFRWLALTPRVSGALRRLGVVEYLHLRDPTVSAERVAAHLSTLGLQCITQELTTWLTRRTWTDCMSTIVCVDGPYARQNRIFRNKHLRQEAAYLGKLWSFHGADNVRPDERA